MTAPFRSRAIGRGRHASRHPLGNGKLLICFERNYSIRDLYFPHVGQEDHIGVTSSASGSGRRIDFLGWGRIGNGTSATFRNRSEDWVEQLLPQACNSIYGMCEVR
jgi:hypothetical protein